MTTTVLAVYQNGVLRPVQPLPFAEGETVEITLSRPKTLSPALSEAEAIQRIETAQTVDEWAAASNAAPETEDGYDLLQALDENRKRSGAQRMLYPPELKGVSW
jgi:predicted DNA-binding antitoxin AbrB/MazE fold protein